MPNCALGAAHGYLRLVRVAFHTRHNASNCGSFCDITHLCRRCMGINVAHIGRWDARVLQGSLHGAESAVAVVSRSRHVICVAAAAVAPDLRVDVRTPGPGVLEFLQDQNCRTLRDDETITVAVEGTTAGVGVVVVGRGEGPCPPETCKCQGMDAGLCSASNHDVGIAKSNESHRVANGMRAGCAGGCNGMVRALQAVLHGDMASGQVDENFGDEQRRNLLVALSEQTLAWLRSSITAAQILTCWLNAKLVS